MLKHGRHIDYNAAGKPDGYTYDFEHPGKHYAICFQPVNSKSHLSNVLLTMAQKMDVDTEKFADSNSTVSDVL